MSLFRYTAESAPGQMLAYIQRHGEATVKDLASLLDVSATAVREHLVHLQADDLIVARTERRGPGRPRLVYALSEKAKSRFPKQYDQLLSMMLHELMAQEGSERVDQLLDRVSQRLASDYSDHIRGRDIRTRLNELRRMLEQRGVPAEVAMTGNGIRLFACPYYDIAHAHPQICVMERQMLEYVLGEKLDLADRIRDGFHSCQFTLRGPQPLVLEDPR